VLHASLGKNKMTEKKLEKSANAKIDKRQTIPTIATRPITILDGDCLYFVADASLALKKSAKVADNSRTSDHCRRTILTAVTVLRATARAPQLPPATSRAQKHTRRRQAHRLVVCRQREVTRAFRGGFNGVGGTQLEKGYK
jgi:hypothetical protein